MYIHVHVVITHVHVHTSTQLYMCTLLKDMPHIHVAIVKAAQTA